MLTRSGIEFIITFLCQIPPERIWFAASERAFELLIHGLNGKNFRFACSKTSGKLDFENCTYKVRHGRITVVLSKKNAGDFWDELFKVRHIGEPKYDSDDD